MSRTVKIKKQTLDRVVNRDQKILACKGVYSAITTAKYFGVTRKTVYVHWNKGGASDEEPPNIRTDVRDKESLYADAVILLDRGLGLGEVAANLGTSTNYLSRILRSRPTGRALLIRHQESVKAWRRGREDRKGSYGPNMTGESPQYGWANEI